MAFWIALLALQDSSTLNYEVRSVRGLDAAKLRPAAEAEFLERLSVDLRGAKPSAAEWKAFEEDKGPDKQGRKVDEWLASPAFAAHWGSRLSSWLLGPPGEYRIALAGIQPEAERATAGRFTEWMTTQVAADRPWTGIVRALIEARGESKAVPELAYKLGTASELFGSRDFALGMARHFLGIRLYCATCHDHPYDRWRTEDLWSLAAFAARDRVRVFGGGSSVELSVKDTGDQEIPRDPDANDKDAKVNLAQGGTAEPVFLFGGQAGKNDDRAKILSALLIWKGNTQFPRAFVNQLWAWIFGRGLVHPADDFNLRNKAVSPALLDALTRSFVDGGHSIKGILRTLCAMELYRAADVTAPGQEAFSSFRGTLVKVPAVEKPPADVLPVPEGWTFAGRSNGYRWHFKVPDKEGKAGDAVFGSWSSWTREWSSQLQGCKKPTEEKVGGAGDLVIYDATGAYTCDRGASGPRPNHRVLIGRIRPDAKGSPKYFRLEGPAETVGDWRDTFVELLKKAVP